MRTTSSQRPSLTCDRIERDEIAEQYLLGRLDEQASADFEAHYFYCPRCRERLSLLESTRAQLVRLEPPRTRPPRRYWSATAGLAAAAVLIVTVRVLHETPSTPPANAPAAASPQAAPRTGPIAAPRGPDLAALGAVDPPAFSPPRLRASPDRSRRVFLEAMRPYQRGDYAGAIPGLRDAVAADPRSPQAHFFLAVCDLELDRGAEAIEHLTDAIRLGESPYLEDAHFFLAKALVRRGALDAARRELRAVVALRGDRQKEAARLLEALQ